MIASLEKRSVYLGGCIDADEWDKRYLCGNVQVSIHPFFLNLGQCMSITVFLPSAEL